MKRMLLATLVCVIAFGTLAGAAAGRQTSTVKMTAQLTAKQAASLQSVKVTGASGRFAGTLLRDRSGRSKLSWTLTYRHMSSRVTKAELVIPAKGKLGSVSIQLCRRCKASARGAVGPILKASTKALLTRPASVIVYTKKNRRGEIRGRVVRAR